MSLLGGESWKGCGLLWDVLPEAFTGLYKELARTLLESAQPSLCFVLFYFAMEPHLEVLRAYSQLFTQGSLLEGLEDGGHHTEPYRVLEI